jgi:hypothetical protein
MKISVKERAACGAVLEPSVMNAESATRIGSHTEGSEIHKQIGFAVKIADRRRLAA